MSEIIVQTDNLDFSYIKSSRDIKNLNLRVPKGSIYGFLGPNGSGKTTTIRLLLGLLNKYSGNIRIFDTSFANNRIQCLQKIGALIENPSLYYHLSALENLVIASNYRGKVSRHRIDEVLDIVKLTYAKDKKVVTYSLGMRQRLGLALALLGQPELLILDEPTNGLDPKGIIEMRALIKKLNEEQGITIFISSHLLTEIERICSHVGIIRDGQILFQDTVKSLRETHSEKLILEIETNNVDSLGKVATIHSLNPTVVDKNRINISVNQKDLIPQIIDVIRTENIDIYQVKIKDDLEDLFLSLTK